VWHWKCQVRVDVLGPGGGNWQLRSVWFVQVTLSNYPLASAVVRGFLFGSPN